MIYELEQYRHKENLPVGTVLHWTEQLFPRIDSQSANVQAHSKAWKSVYERITTQKHKAVKSKDHINVHKEHVVGFMQQSFIIAQTLLTQRDQLTQSMQNPPVNKILSSHNPLLSMAEYQGEIFGKYVKNTESKMQQQEKKRAVMTKKLIEIRRILTICKTFDWQIWTFYD